MIENQLNDIVSPFMKRLLSIPNLLTHQETKVASMVRSGMATKEIADFLNVSIDAVDFHRKNIRKKLGINKKGINLYTYLNSLTEV